MNSFHPKVSICKPQGDGDGRDLDDTTGHGRHAGSVAVVGLFHVAARCSELVEFIGRPVAWGCWTRCGPLATFPFWMLLRLLYIMGCSEKYLFQEGSAGRIPPDKKIHRK